MWEICYPETLQTLNWENVDISTRCTCENNLTGFIDSRDIRPCIQAEKKRDMLMEVILSITSSNYDLSVWITWNTLRKFHSPLGYLSPPSWIPNFNFKTDALWLAADVNFKTMQSLDWCKSLKIGLKDWWFFSAKKIWCSPLFENSKFHLRTCARRAQMICWVFPVNWRLFRVDVLFAGSSRANGANNNF